MITGSMLVLGILIYIVLSHKRWIRVRAMVSLVTLLAAAPAISVVVRAYGIDISVNDSSYIRDFMVPVVVGLAVLCLYFLEINFQKNEAHHKLLHEIQTVFMENLKKGLSAEAIAHKHGIPLEKVEAIIISVGLISVWNKQKPKIN